MDPRRKRFELLGFFLLYVGLGSIFLPVLTDWVSFIVDEGFTSYGAERLREGQWPHRDFFFLWTPGILAWHALLQALGGSWIVERASSLVAAAATGVLLLRQAQEWNFSPRQRLLLALGMLLWSFSLWNIPYSSWYALPIALLGARLAGRNAIIAGLIFALSFWFKQNMGTLACAGAWAALLYQGDRSRALKLALGFSLGVAIPFLGFLLFGGAEAFTQAFFQIFLFPFRYPSLMSEWPPRNWISSSITLFGLWIFGLFSLQPNVKGSIPQFLRVAVVVYLAYAAWSLGQGFFLGFLMVFSCLAWLLAFGMVFGDLPKERRGPALLFFLPAFGAFLQVYPRVDFQHFLFVFPAAFFALFWSLQRLRARYPRLRGLMISLPVIVLLAGGILFQYRLAVLRYFAQEDQLGMLSLGWPHKVNDEMAAVIQQLHALGLRKGDPVLVLPNATSFYRWSGFRNPTPHDQFFPGYVEAFGADPARVLAQFETAGGRFLVWQYKSGLKNHPAVQAQIEDGYQVVAEYPEHFSIWRRKIP